MNECLHPDSWPTPAALLSKDPLPELCEETRGYNQRRWRWRELLCRLAEIRGYLQTQAIQPAPKALQLLFTYAKQVVDTVPRNLSEAEHLEAYNSMRRTIADCLLALPEAEDRDPLLTLLDNPFSYVLEPR